MVQYLYFRILKIPVIYDVHYWLVVYLPLWKMMEFVSWDDYSQYMESHKIPWFQTTNQICLYPIVDGYDQLSIGEMIYIYIQIESNYPIQLVVVSAYDYHTIAMGPKMDVLNSHGPISTDLGDPQADVNFRMGKVLPHNRYIKRNIWVSYSCNSSLTWNNHRSSEVAVRSIWWLSNVLQLTHLPRHI